MLPSRTLLYLVVASLALPVVVTVVAGASLLLAGLGDENGAAVLRFVAVATGVVWVLDLVGLVIALAVQSLGCCAVTPPKDAAGTPANPTSLGAGRE